MNKLGAIMIYAASSLTDVMPRLADQWQKATGIAVTFNFDASSRLANQIKEGAPADVFISADKEWMDVAAKDALIDPATRRNIATNELVVIVPVTAVTPFSYDGLKKLALAGENVPAGKYAESALRKLGVWDQVAKKLVRGDNVRTVLAWVTSGEVPAGVVYRTDALSALTKVRVVARLDPNTHPLIVYPAAVIKRSKQPKDAQAFIDYLQTAAAQAVLEAAGFTAPPGG